MTQEVKNLPAMQETQFNSWVGKIPWRREQRLTVVLLPGEFHGRKSLVGSNPWGCKESDTTEHLTLLLSFNSHSGGSGYHNTNPLLRGLRQDVAGTHTNKALIPKILDVYNLHRDVPT